MKPHEVTEQKKRIERYEQLDERRQEIRCLLQDMTKAPVGLQSPFTSDTSESRPVMGLVIDFGVTKNGRAGCSMRMDHLRIPAPELDEWLTGKLTHQLALIEKEIEKL